MLSIEFDEATKNLLNSIGSTDTFAGARVIDLQAALHKFYTIAGAMATTSIRRQLGRSNLYQLNAEYAKKKMENPFRMHVPGTDPDSPLILSGAMYSAINAFASSDSVKIGWNFEVYVPQMATYFQWKSLRADRAMKATVMNMHQRRRAPAPRIRSDVIKEYSEKWEGQTHFMEKGIQLAIPDMTDALRYILSEVINDNAMGLVTVTGEGETGATGYLRRPEDAAYNSAKFADKMERIQAMEDLEHGGEYTGASIAPMPTPQEMLQEQMRSVEALKQAKIDARTPVAMTDAEVASRYEHIYREWMMKDPTIPSWEAHVAEQMQQQAVRDAYRAEVALRPEVDPRWLRADAATIPAQKGASSSTVQAAVDSQQAAQRAGMTYEHWQNMWRTSSGNEFRVGWYKP
jgi:hypothetical protein